MSLNPIPNNFQGYKTTMSQRSYLHCPLSLNSGYRDGRNTLSAAIPNIPLYKPYSYTCWLTIASLINEQYIVTIHCF